MEHRISLTRVRFLTQLSNQLDTFKNLSFLLAVVINLLILLSVSASPTKDLLSDLSISHLLRTINIGNSGPLGSRYTWNAIRLVGLGPRSVTVELVAGSPLVAPNSRWAMHIPCLYAALCEHLSAGHWDSCRPAPRPLSACCFS
jgi:hypothetical protein